MKDPLAAALFEIGRACECRGATDTLRFLALDAVFPSDLRSDARVTRALSDRLRSLGELTYFSTDGNQSDSSGTNATTSSTASTAR